MGIMCIGECVTMGRPKGSKNKLTVIQDAGINTDVSEYDGNIVDIYKAISLRIANSITTKEIQKMSVSQKVVAMATLQDKINLKEGKSTQNIAHQVLHKLDDESISLLKDFSKSLIQSMLNSTE